MAELEFHVSGENRDFLNKMRQVDAKVSETTKKVESEGNKMDAIFKNLGKEIAALGAGFTATKLVSDIVRVRGEFQQLEIAMETMLGSKEKADALMSQLVATAAKTPFGLTDISKGAKQLLAYGTASEEVNETLVRLGNIASGLSIPLNDLVYLYGTTMTQGRLFTQDLRQFMGRGIPLADELAKQFGVTKDKVGELVTEGKVGFPEVEKAIKAMTDEGGKFFNLMEKQSASLTGKISNLEDAWDMMLNEIGTKTQDVASAAIQGVSLLIENYERVGRIVIDIAGIYGTYKAALAVATVAQKVNTMVMERAAVEIAIVARQHHNLTMQQAKVVAMTKILTEAKQKLLATMKNLGKALTNPYVLAAAAVTALGFGIYKLATYQTDAEKAQNRLNDAFAEASSSAASEINKLDELKGRLAAAKKGSAEYYEIKDEIVKNFGKYDSTLGDEIERVGDLSTTYDRLATAIQNAANARMYDKYVEEETKIYDKDVTEKLKELRETIYSKKGLDTADAARTYSKIWKNIFQGEALDDETERVISSFNKVYEGTDDAGNKFKATLNPIRDYIKGLNNLNAQQETFIDNAREMFGIGADTSDFNSGLKKLTEEQLNQTREDLNAILSKFKETKQSQDYSLVSGEDITFATEQQINDAINNVDAYLEQIKAARDKNKPKDKDLDEKVIKKAKDTQEKVEEAVSKAEFNLKQAQTDDEIKLIENERDAKIQALNDELEAYKAIYEAAGKDTRELEEQFARMIEIEKQMANIEIADKRKEISDKNKEELDELLKEFETYQQAVTRIQNEYEEKRKKMYSDDGSLKLGFTQDNVAELERQKNEAIEEVADDFAERSDAFEEWTDSLTSLTISELKQMLALAKDTLQILKNTEGVDELDIAQAEAAVSKLESAVGDSNNAADDSTVKWTELNEVLNESSKAFSELGEAVPGVAGDILSGIGQISSMSISIANGINALGDAMSNAEKASAILAIISAAIKVVTYFTNIAEKNSEANEKASEAARNYAEALNDISESAAIDKNDTIFGNNIFGSLTANAEKAKQNLKEINSLIEKGAAIAPRYDEVFEDFVFIGSKEAYDKLVAEWDAQRLGTNMASDMRSGWQKFWGSDKNQSLFDLSTLYGKDGIIDEAKFKEFEAWYEQWGDGLSDENKIIAEEILANWEDYQEAMEEIKNNVKQFFSSVSSDIAGKMLDSWIETGNAIVDATALVGDYAKAIAKAAAEQFLLETVFKNAEQDMLNLMMQGDYEGAMSLLKALIEEANTYVPDLVKIFEGIDDATGSAITSSSEKTDEREPYKKGIATASQDSVDENNARLTAIQGHTYSINEECRKMSSYGAQIVSRLYAIERNTSHLSTIMSHITAISSDLETIKTKGVPIQ